VLKISSGKKDDGPETSEIDARDGEGVTRAKRTRGERCIAREMKI